MLRLWQRSGLSVRAFCERHDLSQPSFYAWRRTLAERDEQAIAFVPLEVLAEPFPLAPESEATGLELVLTGERVLRIGPAFDEPTLRRLLAVLQERRP
jgi:hypothetical protein